MFSGLDSVSSLAQLYSRPFIATRTGPLYNAFSYPTKIAPETVALFIATHTRVGATVLDPFAGSGTTGLAARLCESPTPQMLAACESLGIRPQWGPRHVVLYDVSVIGCLIADVLCNPPDTESFVHATSEILARAEAEYGWLYETESDTGNAGRVRYTIWSDILVCSHCAAERTFWSAAVRFDPLRMQRTFTCSSCGSTNLIEKCERAFEQVSDPFLGRPIERKRRVPVVVYGRSGNRDWRRDADARDAAAALHATKVVMPDGAPLVELNWGDLHRSGYHRGITHLHHLYTPRNFLALASLWKLIDDYPGPLQRALRLLVLSYNASHATLMTRVVVKKGKRDLVLTGAQSGVLYVSGLPVEKNVFDGIRRKVATFVEAFSAVSIGQGSVDVRNASSTHIDLPNRSVDYVFTDPPFGDYIPYAEVNEVNEAWLGRVTRRTDEIVISRSAQKDVGTYGEGMARVFGEVSRVLRNEGIATVVFHSAKAEVWRALTEAYGSAGLRVGLTSVLDKVQASFKQTVSDVNVKGDPLMLLTKVGSAAERPVRSANEMIASVVAAARGSGNPIEVTKERLFSRFVAECLLDGVSVPMGAAEFYAAVESN